MNILNEMIEDKNLVWDKSLNNQIEKFPNKNSENDKLLKESI